ncbi:HNH endonuclease [Paenibacillus wenxiniae]|uniref:HNH endonuclease n=1 Tax=Paenibacillus wenxiniae TaxID=1636843 RepID=A0ABW4RNG2_9BACL
MQHHFPESAAAAAGEVDPAQEQETHAAEQASDKVCSRCGQMYPLSHYLKRTGRKSGRARRRGTCRSCRKQLKNAHTDPSPASVPALTEIASEQPISSPGLGSDAISSNITSTHNTTSAPTKKVHPSATDHESGSPIVTARPVRSLPSIEPSDIRGHGLDLSILRPTRRGIVHMRGRTDKGRRWHQETDLETAITLVKQYAAVVVNRHTIRRLYSNRSFRKYILERDHYTCYFCGGPGDTIDHLLPRARGGHTTPLNCVCACNLCNQAKADHDLHHFIQPIDDER